MKNGKEITPEYPPTGQVEVKTKTCPKCGQEIPEAQYAHHVLQCKPSTGATE